MLFIDPRAKKWYLLVLSPADTACTGSRIDGVDAAADHLSHAIALEPRFWPALVEKARLWAAVGDWEQVRTVAGRKLRAYRCSSAFSTLSQKRPVFCVEHSVPSTYVDCPLRL